MLEKSSKTSSSFSSVQALVDLQALKNNYARLKSLSLQKNSGAQILAVIKADAYGHGLIPVAKALAHADGLAVARIEEALLLRQAGLKNKIILLEGVFSLDALQVALANNIELVFHNHTQLSLLEQVKVSQAKHIQGCWIKVNTGMNRLGFAINDLAEVVKFFETFSWIKPEVLMTHLANADSNNPSSVKVALEKFEYAKTVCSNIKQFSIANSAALMAFPASCADWNRPGISLYGSSLLSERDNHLQTVMSLKTKVLAIQKVAAGESVGYGGIWRAEKNTQIAVVGIGYGDGYPRHARNGTPVMITGKEYPLVGRVSMDMITVELGTQHAVNVGDTVLLWGEDQGGAFLSVDRIAECAGTISYQLFCGVTSRVEKVYING